MHDLECVNLTKRFGSHTAVNDVSFSVPRGSFFSILGPSGCGKTTLMRMIAGFEQPSSGDIRIKGRSVLDVAPNKRSVKMVFQHLALFPMMNVGENIAYGLKCQGENRTDIERKVKDVLARVGLPGVAEKEVSQLSGGQKQRIAIARCMVLEPDVLLLDEPLGALDLKLREQMKIELKLLQNQFNTTFLYITHDQSEALIMSDNVAVMNAGRFEQIGSPQDLYNAPATGFVAGFVGDANRWPGRVTRAAGREAMVALEDGTESLATQGHPLNEGDRIELFLRPEAISLSPIEGANQISGQVDSLLFNGANSRVLVRAGARRIEVTQGVMDATNPIKAGDHVTLYWRREHALAFPASV
ncbi:ABC transporter ATP-binding protein [Pseudogemmobacter faecipullorum]|uniref:ABC transporter ATP-binding protein n=1 Tax=Pseudogemmobacter faecipullorum TaxID=2755041 RepID=A0ABS8CI81_9RHOB|nr:ABC transporter ATP-binding protein [Pseudogemmobacter faecipullorum]MCB5409076.1 ABC transporter ATP-binding protein [Pseudogemmobacter faecipullorum]